MLLLLKVLGQIFTFGAIAHASVANTTSPAYSRPLPIKCVKLLCLISSNFQHCIRWEGGIVTRLKKENSTFFKLQK